MRGTSATTCPFSGHIFLVAPCCRRGRVWPKQAWAGIWVQGVRHSDAVPFQCRSGCEQGGTPNHPGSHAMRQSHFRVLCGAFWADARSPSARASLKPPKDGTAPSGQMLPLGAQEPLPCTSLLLLCKSPTTNSPWRGGVPACCVPLHKM